MKLLIIIRDVIMRIPTHRKPTHPGEMLLKEFLIPMGLTQKELAEAIHVPYQKINSIINQKGNLNPSIALRLSRFFGVSADFWLNLQVRWDLSKVRQHEGEEIASITPFIFSRKQA